MPTVQNLSPFPQETDLIRRAVAGEAACTAIRLT